MVVASRCLLCERRFGSLLEWVGYIINFAWPTVVSRPACLPPLPPRPDRSVETGPGE